MWLSAAGVNGFICNFRLTSVTDDRCTPTAFWNLLQGADCAEVNDIDLWIYYTRKNWTSFRPWRYAHIILHSEAAAYELLAALKNSPPRPESSTHITRHVQLLREFYSKKELSCRRNRATLHIRFALARDKMRSGADLNGDNLQISRAYLRISDHCRVTVRVRVRVADCCIRTAGESDKFGSITRLKLTNAQQIRRAPYFVVSHLHSLSGLPATLWGQSMFWDDFVCMYVCMHVRTYVRTC